MSAFLTPDNIEVWNGVNVKIKYFLLTNSKNNPNKISLPAKRPSTIGVTVHNTDPVNITSGTTQSEQYSRATFNGNMGTVRPTGYICDKECWMLLPQDQQNWTNADGTGDGNTKTMSFEVVMSSAKTAANNQARDNAARIIAFYLNQHKLNASNGLFTHSYWLNVMEGVKGDIDFMNTRRPTGRNADGTANSARWCPLYILPDWQDFKELVQGYVDELSGNKPAPSSVLYCVQIGAFFQKPNAEAILADVKRNGFTDAFIDVQTGEHDIPLHRVQVGAYGVKANADTMLLNVQKYYKDAFIKQKTRAQ